MCFTRAKWTGRSVFRKVSAPPVDSAVVDASGSPVQPATLPAMQASLATCREPLREARNLDPRLAQIIGALKGQPAGTYIADPRAGELRKAQYRALSYSSQAMACW